MQSSDGMRQSEWLGAAHAPRGWVLVPKYLGNHAFILGATFGAGLALSFAGLALGHRGLGWGLPAALAVMVAHGWYLRRKEARFLKEFPGGAREPSADRDGEGAWASGS